MTRPLDPDHPRRALDGLEPPPGWHDVVARAARPDVAELARFEPGRRRRPVVLAAAAVVVVAALAGAVAVAVAVRDDGHPGDRVRTAEPTPDRLERIWGRSWQATTVQDRSSALTWSFDELPLTFDLRSRGVIGYHSCNEQSTTAIVQAGRLRSLGGGGSTMMGCRGPLGDQEHWLGAFFRAEPEISLRGDDLVLRTGDATVELVEVRTPVDRAAAVPDQPPSAIWGERWAIAGARVQGHDPRSVNVGPAPHLIVLDATEEGTLTMLGCNELVADVQLEDGHLVGSVSLAARRGCLGADGPALMAQDELLAEVLRDRPLVTIVGTQLYLVTDRAVLSFFPTNGASTRAIPNRSITTVPLDPSTTVTTRPS